MNTTCILRKTVSATVQRDRKLRSAGFTILELLVTMSTMGVLMGLVLPAVQHAREGSRRIQCANNLRQLGIALHHSHDIHNRLPAGWTTSPSNNTAWGWATEILPLLEQSTMASSITRNRCLSDSENANVCRIQLPVMICPSDIAPSVFDLYLTNSSGSGRPALNSVASTKDFQVRAETDDDDDEIPPGTATITLPRANYVGIFGNRDPDESPERSGEGVFLGNYGVRFRDLTRGLSNVAIVGERTARRLPVTWIGVDLRGEDAVARLTSHADRGPNVPSADECEMDSRHPGGINVLFADGHVQEIHNGIDRDVYRGLVRRTE